MSGAWRLEPRIREPARSGSHLSSRLQGVTLRPGPPFWARGAERERDREVSLPLLTRPPNLLDWDLTLVTSFNLNYLQKAVSPNTVAWGVRAPTCKFWTNQSMASISKTALEARR